ncbi:MAG: phosphonoacetaldehyde reductase [Candidatus Marinimicrobia bacterium]|nr:phosphonoacetaldehyde reductase [Candidatus Neomarinimicrobiota bacterium]
MYYNPVKVIETNDWRSALTNSITKLNIKNPLVVASPGNVERNGLLKMFNGSIIFSDIENNPTFESCQRAIDFSRNNNFDGIIALGGGSVMDTAKTVMAASGNDIFSITDLLSDKLDFSNRIPAIFIPTTHGTASEVTMWGTIWNMTEKRKYSLAYPELYPDVAILDGSLTLSMPLVLSITTVLDALSHCFEAIWNKNANTQSTDYAIEGIRIILENVSQLKKNPQDIEIRNKLLKASNLAGLAFSNTKTAAAHSMSYPLTISYGIPHGIACSMPIIPLLKINEKAMQMELEKIYARLRIKDLSELEQSILQIPEGIIDFNLSKWGVKQAEIDDIVEGSFTKSRMENNIVDLTSEDILSVVNSII